MTSASDGRNGRHLGQVQRRDLPGIHHNYEANYWWYRGDIFDERGLAVLTTWEEVAAPGEEFTDEGAGIYLRRWPGQGGVPECLLP